MLIPVTLTATQKCTDCMRHKVVFVFYRWVFNLFFFFFPLSQVLHLLVLMGSLLRVEHRSGAAGEGQDLEIY